MYVSPTYVSDNVTPTLNSMKDSLRQSGGQSASGFQSASSLSASGAWQQTSGSGSNDSHTWQSSSQWGSYSHVVNGVTLSGTFSQSGSVDDRSHFSSSGSASSSGQWIPTGSGSDTLVTSASDTFSGSGSATGVLSPSSGVSWVSSGTQTEQEVASANASHTTYFSLLQLPSTAGGGAGGGGAASGIPAAQGYGWQATSGNGTTLGGGTTFAQYSGSGQYTVYSGYADGSIQGSFSQAQSNTQSWSFNTNDNFQPATSTSPGFWQASGTGSSGTTVDSGGSSFYYSGSGTYGYPGEGAYGTLSQSGSGNETFSYTKNYSIGSGGNWQVLPSPVGGGSGGEGVTGGGASGSGWTFASYNGQMPCSGGSGGVYNASLTATDYQSGSNSTSYSFQTVAAFNGVDWGEVGSKGTTGSGQTNDHVNSVSGADAYQRLQQHFVRLRGAGIPGRQRHVAVRRGLGLRQRHVQRQRLGLRPDRLACGRRRGGGVGLRKLHGELLPLSEWAVASQRHREFQRQRQFPWGRLRDCAVGPHDGLGHGFAGRSFAVAGRAVVGHGLHGRCGPDSGLGLWRVERGLFADRRAADALCFGAGRRGRRRFGDDARGEGRSRPQQRGRGRSCHGHSAAELPVQRRFGRQPDCGGRGEREYRRPAASVRAFGGACERPADQ